MECFHANVLLTIPSSFRCHTEWPNTNMCRGWAHEWAPTPVAQLRRAPVPVTKKKKKITRPMRSKNSTCWWHREPVSTTEQILPPEVKMSLAHGQMTPIAVFTGDHPDDNCTLMSCQAKQQSLMPRGHAWISSRWRQRFFATSANWFLPLIIWKFMGSVVSGQTAPSDWWQPADVTSTVRSDNLQSSYLPAPTSNTASLVPGCPLPWWTMSTSTSWTDLPVHPLDRDLTCRRLPVLLHAAQSGNWHKNFHETTAKHT